MSKTSPLPCTEPSAWRAPVPTPRPSWGLRVLHRTTSPAGARPLQPQQRVGAERPAEPAEGMRRPERQGAGRERATDPVLTPTATGPAQKLLFLRVPDEFLPAALLLGFSAGHAGGSAAATEAEGGDCGVRPRSFPAAARRPDLTLRKLHPPLPLRRSECQTRGGGAAAGGGGGGGGGRDRAGWVAPSPAPIGGHAAAHGLSLVRHALLLPLGFGGSAYPQLSLPPPLGTRARPPPPTTSAETGRGRRKSEDKTDRRTAEPARVRLPRSGN